MQTHTKANTIEVNDKFFDVGRGRKVFLGEIHGIVDENTDFATLTVTTEEVFGLNGTTYARFFVVVKDGQNDIDQHYSRVFKLGSTTRTSASRTILFTGVRPKWRINHRKTLTFTVGVTVAEGSNMCNDQTNPGKITFDLIVD